MARAQDRAAFADSSDSNIPTCVWDSGGPCLCVSLLTPGAGVQGPRRGFPSHRLPVHLTEPL